MSPTREGTGTLTADERAVARLRLVHAVMGKPAPSRLQRRAAARRAAAAAGRARRTEHLSWEHIDEDRA